VKITTLVEVDSMDLKRETVVYFKVLPWNFPNKNY
jgi:hypothetical protein